MTEELTSLHQQFLSAQREIRRLKQDLAQQEESHREALQQCWLAIIHELDLIEEASRQPLIHASPGSPEYLALASTCDELRRPLLAILQTQGVHRIPHPYNKLPQWSVWEGPSDVPRPTSADGWTVVKEGYARGEWLIRPASLAAK